MQLVLSNEVRAHERLTKVESININSKGLCCYLRYCNSVLRIAIVQVATRHHCYVQLLIRYRENSIWTFARNELLLWNQFRTCIFETKHSTFRTKMLKTRFSFVRKPSVHCNYVWEHCQIADTLISPPHTLIQFNLDDYSGSHRWVNLGHRIKMQQKQD